jgi:hypothetical protein
MPRLIEIWRKQFLLFNSVNQSTIIDNAFGYLANCGKKIPEEEETGQKCPLYRES